MKRLVLNLRSMYIPQFWNLIIIEPELTAVSELPDTHLCVMSFFYFLSGSELLLFFHPLQQPLIQGFHSELPLLKLVGF